MINQLPRPFGFCVFRSTLVVPRDPLFYVLSRTDIVAAVLKAFKDVNKINHGTKKACHAIKTNATGSLLSVAGTTRLELATFPQKSAGRSSQGFNRFRAFLPFDCVLSSHSFRPVWMLLMINQLPRPLGFCVFRSTLVVPRDPFIQVLGRSNVITSVIEALEDVDEVRHC